MQREDVVREPVLWVVGGGSGVGRAVAVSLADTHTIVVSGRREQNLKQTAELVEARGGTCRPIALDVRDPARARVVVDEILATYGGMDGVVLAGGLNAVQRDWADQSMGDFRQIVDTNLVGVAEIVDLVLPHMSAAGRGDIVVVSSRSAWRFSPGAGVAYMASKSALASLCASLNDQCGASGVRATHLCPGDIDTDFLKLRPVVPDSASRSAMLTPTDVAESIRFVLERPAHVRIDELVITPIGQR